jgi:hypothetical protein
MKKYKLPKVYIGVKNPETLFDMICARNWFCGNLDSNIPVDESREAYHAMKEMILDKLPDF